MSNVLSFLVEYRFELVSAACLIAAAAAVLARLTPNKTDDAVADALKSVLEALKGSPKSK